jgi:signal transduction histidine kinase
MSLRLRLAMTYALFVAFVMAALGGILYFTMRGLLANEMDRRLTVRADQVQRALWPSPNPTDLAPGNVDLRPLSELDAPNISVHVLDLSGRLLAASDNLQGLSTPLNPEIFAGALAGGSGMFDLKLPSGRLTRILDTPITIGGQMVAVLEVVQGRDVLRQTMDGLKSVLLLLGVVGVVTSGGAGWWVAYRGLRPLSTISDQAARIAADHDFSHRLDVKLRGRDEIGRLAATIDELLEKVDETLRAHRDFVSDTSHELRNPLLALRTNLELMDRVTDGDAREECIREAVQQVERMSRLVSDLLTLAKVESKLLVQRRPVDLVEIAERAVREARYRAGNRDLVVEGSSSVEVMADEGQILQIMGNLLDNAVKYTPPHGTIRVCFERGASGATFRVEDNGRGIAPDDLPRVFERTYRGNGSGTASNGNGLGLAIVKHLVEAHGGSVEAESEPNRGTSISVHLP